MAKRKRRAFTTEFKAQAVRIVRESGKSVGVVARELDLTGRADLRGPADRPVVVLRAQGTGSRSPPAARASAAGRGTVRAHLSRVAGEPRGLRRPQSLEAAQARRARCRPLYGGAPDAAPRPRRREARAAVHGDDDPGYRGGATAGSGDAAVQGRATEPAVGRRPDVRGHVARIRLRGVRYRRILAPDRRLAGVDLAAQRPGPRCAGAGALRSPHHPSRAAG